MESYERRWMKPILLESKITSESKIASRDSWLLDLPHRGLKLIGIRFYPFPGQSREVKRKVMLMQKNLYGHDWLYFNKGFEIVEENKPGVSFPEISHIEVKEDAFDSSFLLYSVPEGIDIGFSAIIGENGTGKSTIVDMAIRLINNLAAAIIGEGYVYSRAEHLHYIDNVYAALAVYIGDGIKILHCLGRKLYITTYHTDINALEEDYRNVKKGEKLTELYMSGEQKWILNGSESPKELLPPQPSLEPELREWFYTLVGNYSLYAYNYRDFLSEQTDAQRLSKLKTEIQPDDRVWLKGVFHKNDGYQTPIVIHPMRNNGYVDGPKVNYIGKQNLISLAFVKARDSEKFPFRTINKTHRIVAFYFPPVDDDIRKRYHDRSITEKLKEDGKLEGTLRSLEEPIIRFWADAIGVGLNYSRKCPAVQPAWDYVVYKTLKISRNYKLYEHVWESIVKGEGQENIDDYLKRLTKDSTHRTLKLRQALAFLRFREEKGYYLNQAASVDLDAIYEWMKTKLKRPLYVKQNLHAITIDDLLPPPSPICDVVLQLVDNDHLREYENERNRCMNIIPFEGLSSGERQIAYTMGNIIYHLKNLDSVEADRNPDPHHLQPMAYEYVNIMLDEVELYFHPDLQRRFVSLLLSALKNLELKKIHGINVTLITHSPFVLSDIPSENILSLSRSEENKLHDRTFAANIHDLFNNTFFLSNTIGELAAEKISEIVDMYDIWRSSSRREDRINYLETKLKRDWARMRYIANITGDEYLREEIRDMLEEMERSLENEADQLS